MTRASRWTIPLSLVLLLWAGGPLFAAPSSPYDNEFTLFESGQVRPLAMDPTGHLLFAVNTPDNRLEIFRILPDLHPEGPIRLVGSVQVGLEPVAVAARSRTEVWVVNHLSDSISIVDVASPQNAYVKRTLLVGDEPRDVVFAGADGDRAFVTTAHRGQNSPIDPQLTTPGVGRADVWVFDAGNLGSSFGGDPLTILTLFTDTPRALATSADGSRVYAAGFHTGNQTTTVFSFSVNNAPGSPGLPAPDTNVQGLPKPKEGLIVKYDGEHWRDEASGSIWDEWVRLDLPDRDVFTIDATANPPVEIAEQAYSGVGTILFNMVTHPVSGKVYVTNTEARNERRFEGPGVFSGGETVRGRLHQARITVLESDAEGPQAAPRHLNKHIDYDDCCDPLPNAVNDRSLAQPTDLAISDDGSTLYVAAFGSAKVGVFSTAELENDSFVPDSADHIELSGGGPSGLALDEQRSRLYVLTRFDNTVSVIDVGSRRETARHALFNPEPEHIRAGRPFLYDARLSSNGEASCASCHVFGDLDSLAWNLGNPDGTVLDNPGPLLDPQELFAGFSDFHPMKGPMTTQSLRGMANHGAMHWRGDRNGNNEVLVSEQPNTGLFDERQAFREFNPAFEGLLGGPAQLPPEDMDAFTDFVLEITYPPNPIRHLDNSLTPSQQRGRDHFFREDVAELNLFFPGNFTSCNGCHVLDPDGNSKYGVDKPGFFGADGKGIVDSGGLQHIKAPHFRNLYQKVGMFGLPEFPALPPSFDHSHQGEQIRGFGFTHSGDVPTIFAFLSSVVFSDVINPNGFPFGPPGDSLRRDVESFLFAFPSNMAPVVGQQATLDRDSDSDAQTRVDLLLDRAATSPAECEVVATTWFGGQEESYLYLADHGVFAPDENDARSLSDADLRQRALIRPVTYTCVPVGSGQRIGLDADLDGCYDRSEKAAGTDPRDASSVPGDCAG